MVRQGQYLERSVVIVGDPFLEGLYHRGKKPPAVLVVSPHPDEGSMETTMVAEMGWALARAGCATLRFNWRGVGASSGTLDWPQAAADLEAARQHLAESAFVGAANLKTAGIAFGEGASVLWQKAQDFGTLLLIQPRGRLEAGEEHPQGLSIIVAAEDHADDKERARAFADQQAGATYIEIAGADARFHQGLVELAATVVRCLRPRRRQAYTED